MKLNTKAFALTCGLVWGLGLFLLTWWIIAFDGATGEITGQALWTAMPRSLFYKPG